ncbi:MAG: flagellar biosynthetic protein FliO [Planctomycetes bacterium]|nr:flagellar biosynthetic protein FliO [Planctomycetota bacterium]
MIARPTPIVFFVAVLSLTAAAIAAPAAAPVSATAVPPAAAPQTTPAADAADLTRLAQRMAQRPDSPPAASTPTAASPTTHAASAGVGAGSDPAASVPSSAPLPPVPATDAKESLPLGSGHASPRAPGGANPTATPLSAWFTNTLIALVVVIGAVFLLRSILTKLTGRSPVASNRHVLEVLARVGVASKSHVLLVKLGRRILVVGESPSGLNTLADIDDAEEVAAILQTVNARKAGSATAGFAQTMDRFDSEYGDEDLRRDEGHDTAEQRTDRARDNVSALVSRLRSFGSGGAGAKGTGGRGA